MSRTIKVAAVIPVFNRKALTLQCLSNMRRLDLGGIELRIFIVDDRSVDGTVEAVRAAFPEVVVIEGQGDLWYTGAMNIGIRAALDWSPDYLLLMNDDQVFDDRALLQLVHTAEKFGNCVVGGLLLLWDQPHKVFQVSPMWRTVWGGWRHWQQQTIWTIPQSAWEVELIVGNCMLVPSEVVRNHGTMNERWLPNNGDAEFTPRLRRRGVRLVIEPKARVFCQPNEIPKSPRMMDWKERYRILWGDIRLKHNLRRRFYSYLLGGPDPVRGLIAFVIFFLRYALDRNLEGGYAMRIPEPPLRDLLRANVIPEAKD